MKLRAPDAVKGEAGLYGIAFLILRLITFARQFPPISGAAE